MSIYSAIVALTIEFLKGLSKNNISFILIFLLIYFIFDFVFKSFFQNARVSHLTFFNSAPIKRSKIFAIFLATNISFNFLISLFSILFLIQSFKLPIYVTFYLFLIAVLGIGRNYVYVLSLSSINLGRFLAIPFLAIEAAFSLLLLIAGSPILAFTALAISLGAQLIFANLLWSQIITEFKKHKN